MILADHPVDVRQLETENLPGTRVPVEDILPRQPTEGAVATAKQAPVNGPTLWGAAADVG